MRGGSWIFPTTRWSHYLIDGFTCRRCALPVKPGRKRGPRAASIHHTTPEAVAADCITLCFACNRSVGHPAPDHPEAGAVYLLPTERAYQIEIIRPMTKDLMAHLSGGQPLRPLQRSLLRDYVAKVREHVRRLR